MREELAAMIAERPVISRAIAEARDKGDLSENAEYDAAKDEQGEIETRIHDIEEILENAEIASDEFDENSVYVGSAVTVYDLDAEEEMVVRIVGANEVNSMENRVSGESPMGKALIGGKVGDTVTVTAPGGSFELKILKIARA